jgi:hypothetical protein
MPKGYSDVVNKRRTDNVMSKRKRKTMILETLHKNF